MTACAELTWADVVLADGVAVSPVYANRPEAYRKRTNALGRLHRKTPGWFTDAASPGTYRRPYRSEVIAVDGGWVVRIVRRTPRVETL